MTLREMINAGALFFLNHSGGKDSQAMAARMARIVPADQLIIIHAALPGVDWEGLEDHIRANSFGIPVYVCQAKKTFFEMVERRGMFPSPTTRNCTSDLKRDPIEQVIRRVMKERGATLAVNCQGLRAEESNSRAKLDTWKLNKRLSRAGRTVIDFLPIHAWKVKRVMLTIKNAGQKPFRTYEFGLGRCSCKICIFSSVQDIKIVAQEDPAAFNRYADLEERIDFTMIMPKKNQAPRTLRQIVNN